MFWVFAYTPDLADLTTETVIDKELEPWLTGKMQIVAKS